MGLYEYYPSELEVGSRRILDRPSVVSPYIRSKARWVKLGKYNTIQSTNFLRILNEYEYEFESSFVLVHVHVLVVEKSILILIRIRITNSYQPRIRTKFIRFVR